MKITTIKYNKKFPYAPYLNIDIGFEATLDNDGYEDPINAIKQLDALAEQYYREKYPPTQEQTPYPEVLSTVRYTPEISQTEEKISDTRPLIERYLTEIQSYTDPLKLEKEWQLLAKSNPKLQEAYTEKLKSLNNG